MRPTLAIANITSYDVDTVIIWHDGDRHVAYAYGNGRVIRTTPLQADDPAGQADEIRRTFHITDGEAIPIGAAASIPSAAIATGPRRWE